MLGNGEDSRPFLCLHQSPSRDACTFWISFFIPVLQGLQVTRKKHSDKKRIHIEDTYRKQMSTGENWLEREMTRPRVLKQWERDGGPLGARK